MCGPTPTTRALRGLVLAPLLVMETGQIVDGRYRIDACIGTGAMGVVYRAYDLVNHEPVALKTIGCRCSDDDVAVAGLRAEARALSEVTHPNVIALLSRGGEGDGAYLVLEYVDGPTLQTMMRDARSCGALLPERQAVGIVYELAHALDAVHACGLVHRDVKPSNVVVERSTGCPVLLDFGLTQRPSGGVAVSGMVVGTPLYMAPEQAKGGVATARSDLYALACMTFELFSGRNLFADAQPHSILLAHVSCPAPAISTVNPELAALDDVLLRALSKDPSARHDTCLAFANELLRAWKVVRERRRSDYLREVA